MYQPRRIFLSTGHLPTAHMHSKGMRKTVVQKKGIKEMSDKEKKTVRRLKENSLGKQAGTPP